MTRPVPPIVLEAEVAVRAFVPRTRRRSIRRRVGEPELNLILDTETRTDHAQALLCGSYQVRRRDGKLLREGLFHGEVTRSELAVLRQYVADHPAANGGHLTLHTLSSFLRDVFWQIAYKGRARVVGFNLPFDLSRLAFAWAPARNGGFTLYLYASTDDSGRIWPDRYRPALRIKSLDARRPFMSFAAPAELDHYNRVGGYVDPGRFLDLRMLSYALTDRSLSLDGAAAEFGLAVRKDEAPEHGVLTAAYIDYNRQDTEVTWQLHQALIAEFDRHPIAIAPEQGYSAAAIGKAYLEAAGIRPPAERARISPERMGQAMTAYYGGRTECRIRGVPLPVRYVDFASMYPTVFALEGLWSWVTARRLTDDDATDDARAMLEGVDRTALHDPTLWPRLAGVFCRIRPAGDLLPVRARYGADVTPSDAEARARPSGSLAWTIGLNRLEADVDLWYTLADLLVAKLLGDTTPAILDAFRVRPIGRAPGLRPVRLRGTVPVNPGTTDLFRAAIEERARLKADPNLSAADRVRLGQFLKTFANGGAYGIFAETRQLDPKPGGTVVAGHGLWPISARVRTPEEPGAYCFPPLAATITGGARLLLALLQADVEARGGAYVACDTDSLLIVSSEAGGPVACPGGPVTTPDGAPAVNALAWAEVTDVLAGFAGLNRYAPGTVPDLIKLEPENFAADDPSRPVELLALAKSSKRYCLYERQPDGIVLRKASEHGLGLYRSPVASETVPSGTGRPAWPAWVGAVWERVIAEAEGREPADAPTWYAHPAVSQLPVSSPAVIAPFREVNAGLPYDRQVKPFNFLLMGRVDHLSTAAGDVTAVAPFSSDPDGLLELPWRNRRDGRPMEVTTRPGGRRGHVRLETIGGVVADFGRHPETKSGDPRGGRGRRGSVGLLPRLTVRATGVPIHIGKESNRLDDVQDGLVTDPGEVYVEYRDERREWEAMLPALRRLRDERGWKYLAEASGLSERALRYALNGGTVPHEPARTRLLGLVSLGEAANIGAR